MDIGNKITELRKQHNFSQTELAKQLGASRTIVGNYERNENTPSIDMILKLAKVFNVSLDYLVGEGQLANYDKEVLKRIEDIEQLLEENKKKTLFDLIDTYIRDAKTRQAYAG